MEKQGVLRISGPTSPKIGEKATYKVEQWYPSTPVISRNTQRVVWELFKKRKNGEFITTNIKKRGLGEFTFTSGTEKDIFRIEGYLYKAEGKELMSIVVQPIANEEKVAPVRGKVIESIKLTDINGNPITKPLSYKDSIHVVAKCRNMAGETVIFSLWEDDEVGAGHNEKNQFITRSKPIAVDSRENAHCDFTLFPTYMKLAQLREDDDSLHEYYILVEYDNSKKASNNVNVINLERRIPDKPKAPVIDSVKSSAKENSTINRSDSKGIIKKIYFRDRNYRKYISKTEHSDKIEVIVEGDNLFDEEITVNIWKRRPKLGVGFVPLGEDKADFELLFSEEGLAFKDNNTGIRAFDLVTNTEENSSHNPLLCLTYEIFAEVIYNKISKKSQMLTTQLCAKPILPENAVSPAFESDTSKKENDKSSCPNCNKDITVEELKEVYKDATNERLKELSKYLNKYRKLYKLDTCARKAHFFAQSIQEASSDLESGLRGEHFNFHKDRLVPAGLKAFKTDEGEKIAEKYARDTPKGLLPEANQIILANYAYGSQYTTGANFKNTGANDGWNFRGRGLLQITGRSNYKVIQDTINKISSGSGIDIYKKYDSPNNAISIANGYMSMEEAVLTGLADWYKDKMYAQADKTGTMEDNKVVDLIVDIINKHTTSRPARRNHYKKTKVTFLVDSCKNISKEEKKSVEKSNKRFDIDKAVAHLNKNAKSSSTGYCGRYVRWAIEAGGLNFVKNPEHAHQFKDPLIKLGFTKLDKAGYIPLKGDIIVIESFTGDKYHESGHIAMYNGDKWVSDFVQRDFWAGPDYRKHKPKHIFLRWIE